MFRPDLRPYPLVAAIIRPLRFARRYTLPAVLVLAVACEDENPVAPLPEAEPAVSEAPRVILQAIRADTAVRLEFTEEISNLESRFFPTLERPLVGVLTTAFQRFVRAMRADDLAGATKALTGARASLKNGTASPADLDALRRSLDALGAAIAPSTD